MFQGLWRYYGESSWDSWWGKRQGQGEFNGFDGLWMGSYGDMYLHTFGNAVMGWYGMTGYALEALMLIEGQSQAQPSTKPQREAPQPIPQGEEITPQP